MADQKCSRLVENDPGSTEQKPEVNSESNSTINIKVDNSDSNMTQDPCHQSMITPSESAIIKAEIEGVATDDSVISSSSRVACNESREPQYVNQKTDEDEKDDFLADDFLDNLSVVDSWNDGSDLENDENFPRSASQARNVGSPNDNVKDSNLYKEKEDGDQSKSVCEQDAEGRRNVDQKDSKSDQKLEASKRRPSQDDRTSNKSKLDTTQAKKGDKFGKDLSSDSKSRDRQSDRRDRSLNTRPQRENENRRRRSRERSNRSAERERNLRRNVDRSQAPRTSRYPPSGSDRNRDPPSGSDRNRDPPRRREDPDSRARRARSPVPNRHSLRRPSAVNREQSSSKTVNARPPMVEKLVPPGTEDEVHSDLTVKGSSPPTDMLVPPGTEEVLLPELNTTRVKGDTRESSKKKSNLSNSEKNVKSDARRESSSKDGDKQGRDRKRRLTSSNRESNKRFRGQEDEVELTDRERVALDQDRISRELSLERLRESRMHGRTRDSRERYRGDRFTRVASPDPHRPEYRSRPRGEGPFDRVGSYDRREWQSRSRDFLDRRHPDLSPVSVGRLSHSPPLSFQFSPVSSRSSSRERYRRAKFRSFSPISSGSDVPRSLFCPSDEERGPRSKRRRRLPFLDEMERKLGLKLTGGHTLNQKLRASQPQTIVGAVGIDMNAPPPGTYPVTYPENYPNQYPTPTPPVYPPNFVPTPTYGNEHYNEPLPRNNPPPRIHVPAHSNAPPRTNVPLRINVPPQATVPPRKDLPPQTNTPSLTTPPPASKSPLPVTDSKWKRQLVALPREPLKITFKFQRPVCNVQLSEVPDAPPPPTISNVAGPEMSLSSLLEASVNGTLDVKVKTTKIGEAPGTSPTVGGKNPVDLARVQRCQVAIQTLQEDESFDHISSGRFVVQSTPKTYEPLNRFDHPAQESMFLLKSPLLRKQQVSLTFTTPPAVPYKPRGRASPTPAQSCAWPKNSEKVAVPAAVAAEGSEGEGEEEEEEEQDVWIVERPPETVVSISSDGSDMALSPVSEVSGGYDPLENVSSGEDEDFAPCVECARRARTADVATQCEPLEVRSISVQVDTGEDLHTRVTPTKGILKPSRPVDLPAPTNYQAKFQPSPGFQATGGNTQQRPSSFPGNQANQNQQSFRQQQFQTPVPQAGPRYQGVTSNFGPNTFGSSNFLGTNTNFGNFSSLGTIGTAPTMVPPPNPVSMQTQNYSSPSGGLGISPLPSGMTRDQYQNYFDGLSSNQSNNY